MKRSERVCAIVPTYNRWPFLLKSLEALCGQRRAVDCILVIDGASTDGTPAAVRERYPHIELLSLSRNLGSAGGFCEGVRWAYRRHFDWIWFIDDDSRVADDALDALLTFSREALPDGPARHVLGPLRLWDDDATFAGLPALRWNFSNPFLLAEQARIPLSARYRTRDELPAWADVQDLAWEGMLVPRNAVADVGLPCSAYFTQVEDTDYSLRLQRAGYRLIMVSASHIYRLIRPHPIRPNPAWKVRYMIRNRLWLNRQYGRNWATRVLRSWLWGGRYLLPSLFKARWALEPDYMRAFYTGFREGLFAPLPSAEPAPATGSALRLSNGQERQARAGRGPGRRR
jgi:GT2 family glycosyltransferase